MTDSARFFRLHRPWVAAVAALVSLLALYGASRTTIDDLPSSLFRSDDEAFARLERTFAEFGADDQDCLVLLEGESELGRKGVDLLRRLDARIARIEGIAQAWSLDDLVLLDEGLPRPLLPAPDADDAAFDAALEMAHEHPLAQDLLLSPDGRVAVIVARLEGEDQRVSVLRKRVESLRAALVEFARPGYRLSLTGVPPLRVLIFDAIRHEQRVFPPISALLGALIALAIFQRIGPVFITTAASGLAALWSLGFMGLIGEPLNLLTASLPLLVMVIAYTDSIHLMIDILRGRQAGLGRVDAAARAIRDLALPCALTSLTTAIGFGSLAVSRIEVIRRYGWVFAASVGMSFLVVLTVVPLLASLLLRRGRRPSLARRFSGMRPLAESLIRALLARAGWVTLLGSALVLGCLLLALGLTPENRLTETTPKDSQAVEALAVLEQHFGGALTAAVSLEWQPSQGLGTERLHALIGAVEKVLEENPLTRDPLSILDLEELLPAKLQGSSGLALLPPQLTRRFLRADLGHALVRVRIPDAGSAECDAGYQELERDLAALGAAYPDVTLAITGTGYVARRNINRIIEDFARGLGLAAGVIFLLLAFAFRSLRLGAVCVLPNALPVVVVAAGLRLSGLELQVPSVLAFTVLLGIAVDDTIHYVSRYQRERSLGFGQEEALVRAYLGVGRALIMTTAVLAAGFSVTLFSSLPTSRLFAGILVSGLIAALAGDMLLLPAAIRTLAREEEAPAAERN